jgi:hypothetical protein
MEEEKWLIHICYVPVAVGGEAKSAREWADDGTEAKHVSKNTRK